MSDRIVKHMNEGHAHNLEDYLVVEGHVPEKDVKDPQMESIDLNSMTISYASGPNSLKTTELSRDETAKPEKDEPNGQRTSVVIKFDPPMKELSDSRELLVKLAKQDAHKRGYSAFKIRKVPVPDTWKEFIYLVIFAGVVYVAYTPVKSQAFLKKTFNLSPSIAEKVVLATKWLLNMVYAAHLTEISLILNPILSKFRISWPQRIVAYLESFIEGALFLDKLESVISKLENGK